MVTLISMGVNFWKICHKWSDRPFCSCLRRQPLNPFSLNLCCINIITRFYEKLTHLLKVFEMKFKFVIKLKYKFVKVKISKEENFNDQNDCLHFIWKWGNQRSSTVRYKHCRFGHEGELVENYPSIFIFKPKQPSL